MEMGWKLEENKFHKWEIVYTTPNKISIRIEDADNPDLVFTYEYAYLFPSGQIWKCCVADISDKTRGNNLRITFW